MALEGFAIGVAQEAGAVGDLGRNFGPGTNGLVVGDEREPAAEGGLIGGIGEAEKMGVPSWKLSVQAGVGWFASGLYAAMERLVGFAVRKVRRLWP